MNRFELQWSILMAAGLSMSVGCTGGASDSRCGPATGVVVNIVDGDTVDLASGERIRYLMIDTPELSSADCYAQEATELNSQLVLDREVRLEYDVECEDRYDRLLAYVHVGDNEINTIMVERGYACLLHIPPNGEDRRDEFSGLESLAKSEERGMWGQCEVVTCD